MDEMISGGGVLQVNGAHMTVSFTVPVGPCAPGALLPDVQRLADQVTTLAEQQAGKAGRAVTCAKGCDACCRQVVPISPTEARHLHAVVEAQPPERAAVLRERFERVRTHMLQHVPQPDASDDKAARYRFAMAWYRQHMDCPFLEDGACSIYADRPITCREFMVTSPVAGCEALDREQIVPLTRAVSVSSVLALTTAERGQAVWLPLTDALHYVETHPEAAPERTGPQWVDAFIGRLRASG